MDLTKLIQDTYESTSLEGTRERNGKLIADGITRGSLKLVEVVEALGSRLTSTAVDDRIIGMSLLGHVFENLEPDFLNEAELKFLVEFLQDRLKDQHLVIPKAILCILPIVRCSNLPGGASTKLLRQLFQETNIQSHTQRHRRAFFVILQYLLQNRINEIKEFGSEFVMSFLQAMDGEKDPRNLILLFSMIPTILATFPLHPFIEDFFEVLSMYFPIDFSPSVGGPDAEVTTRSELAKCLHVCMSQTNQFSELLIPLTLEKLESSVVDAKLDSLNLLAMCCERSYLAADLRPHLPSIWHALRREIFLGGNEEVEQAANEFLRSAFKRLSDDEEVLETALKLIFTECKHHLSEPELRLSQPACRILCSAAEGSQVSCTHVISLTLPILYEQFTTKTSNPERRGILGIMITMMSAIRSFPKLRLSLLLANWDEILWMWFSLLTYSHDQFIVLSLHAFHSLLENEKEARRVLRAEDQHPDFDEKNRDLLQAHLLSILQKDEEEIVPEITSQVIKIIGILAAEFPDEVLRTAVPKLLDLVITDHAAGTDGINEEKMKNYLHSLSSCSESFAVGKVVIPKLVELLIGMKERNENYMALVQTLLGIIEAGSVGVNASDFADCFAQHLTTFIEVGNDARINRRTDLCAQVAAIICKVVRSSDKEKQQALINIFWNEQVASVDLENLWQMNVVQGLLREAFLASVRPAVHIAKKEELMKIYLEKVFFETSEIVSENIELSNVKNKESVFVDALANVRLFCTFLNKAEDKEFDRLLAEVETFLRVRLSIPGCEVLVKGMELDEDQVSPAEEAVYVLDTDDIKLRIIVMFFILIVKAIAMRGYYNLTTWIQEKMILMLNSSRFGKLVAEGFSILMSDIPESLNTTTFCNYRFLYKQRIFQLSIPKLVEGYREAKPEMKANFIRALTGQLCQVPQVLLQMELNNVVPLLVGSLDCEFPATQVDVAAISGNTSSAQLLLSSLTALLELLTPTGSANSEVGKETSEQEKTSPLLDYFMDLAPRLIRLAQYKASMQVRILALKCLQRCAKFPTRVIVPLKEQVVRDLRLCLDDPKRLVRKEAALCRNIWTLTNAPGGT